MNTECRAASNVSALEGFYARAGWRHVPTLSASVGDPADPYPYPYFAMMLFLSERVNPAEFLAAPLFLPNYGW